jgi:hypothetical protein
MEYMNERLIVKNFLCLENIDIEVKDFLILIGPQAAGKSLCAKLLYFFRIAFDEVACCQMISALGMPSNIYMELSNKFESFFPKAYWAGQEFDIEYQNWGKTRCAVRRKKSQKLELYFAPEILAASQKIQRSYQRDIGSNADKEKIKEILKILLNRHINYPSTRSIFIPAGRSFFSLLQKNIFRFLQTSNNIDPFIMEFGIFYEAVKQTEHDIPTEAQTLIRSILKGEYVYADDMLQLSDGKKIALELLSSGQQEALPLALVFAYIISLHLKFSEFTNIHIEEPEAYLFPDAQEKMSRLISFLRYKSDQEFNIAITTHSPYMLAAFNNLIKAGNIVRQNPGLKDAVYKVIPESMHIDVERFSAYSLENGKAVSIIDEESHLINADAIDGVSESIMETFNTLLDIEFDGDKAGKNV